MYAIERVANGLRHNFLLGNAHWLWDIARPLYNQGLAWLNPRGLKRVINGTDDLRVAPQARGVVAQYEPEVWRSLMAELCPGDVVADVGAFIGLYTVALAKRVGSAGRVVAFEPDAINYATLKDHARLNHVRSRIEAIQAVVGTENGSVAFESNGIESHAVAVATENSTIVQSVSIDKSFEGRSLDILKIDVEGYEENVLKGATTLLGDPQRGPRLIYIEVHPYAWSETGASSESLLRILSDNGYQVTFVDGEPVHNLENYGEIIARKVIKSA